MDQYWFLLNEKTSVVRTSFSMLNISFCHKAIDIMDEYLWDYLLRFFVINKLIKWLSLAKRYPSKKKAMHVMDQGSSYASDINKRKIKTLNTIGGKYILTKTKKYIYWINRMQNSKLVDLQHISFLSSNLFILISCWTKLELPRNFSGILPDIDTVIVHLPSFLTFGLYVYLLIQAHTTIARKTLTQ